MLVLSRKLASRLHDRKVQLDVPDENTVVLRAVPIDADSFSKPQTNLLIKRPQAGQPFLICVDSDLSYTGENHSIRSAFRGRIRQQGWQTLMLLPARGHELEATLTAALAMLGFDEEHTADGTAAVTGSPQWTAETAGPPLVPGDGQRPAGPVDEARLADGGTFASRTENVEIKHARPADFSAGASTGSGAADAAGAHAGHPNQGATAARSPRLLDIAIDLTAQLRQNPGLPVIGRDDELATFASVLYRFGESRLPVVTGESGVGRSAFLRAVAGDLAERHPGKRLLVLNAARVVTGVMFNGEYEQLWATVLQEAAADPSLVLVVEHFEMALPRILRRILPQRQPGRLLQQPVRPFVTCSRKAGTGSPARRHRQPVPLRRECERRAEDTTKTDGPGEATGRQA